MSDLTISGSTASGSTSVDFKEDGSVVVSGSIIDFIETAGTLVTNSPSGTARIAMSNYAWLAGRSGGQSLIGGTGSGDDLILTSTSHATKGTIDLESYVRFSPSLSGSVSGDFASMSPSITHAAGTTINYFNVSPTVTTGTVSISRIFYCAGLWTQSGPPVLAVFNMFYAAPTITTSDTNLPPVPLIFYNQASYNMAHGVGTITGTAKGFIDQQSIVASTAAATGITAAGLISYDSIPALSASHASASMTVTNRIVLNVGDVSFTATGTITLTNNIGVNIVDLTVGTSGNRTVTNAYGIYSVMASGTNKFFIYSSGSAQSVHTGLMNFGSTTVPTALVDVDGSTTARSSIRVKSGTAPTSPNSGDVWHDSTRQCLMAACGGLTQGIAKVGFVATAAATVASSTSETTIAGTGIGTLTLPANFLTIGKTIKIRAWGVYGTKAPAVGTFTLRFKYGSTTLISLAPTLTGSLTNQMWEVEAEFTCRTTGATGTVFPQTLANFMTSTTAEGIIVAGPTATTTIDTTASRKVDLTVQWGTSNANNTITCNNFTMEIKY